MFSLHFTYMRPGSTATHWTPSRHRLVLLAIRRAHLSQLWRRSFNGNHSGPRPPSAPGHSNHNLGYIRAIYQYMPYMLLVRAKKPTRYALLRQYNTYPTWLRMCGLVFVLIQLNIYAVEWVRVLVPRYWFIIVNIYYTQTAIERAASSNKVRCTARVHEHNTIAYSSLIIGFRVLMRAEQMTGPDIIIDIQPSIYSYISNWDGKVRGIYAHLIDIHKTHD